MEKARRANVLRLWCGTFSSRRAIQPPQLLPLHLVVLSPGEPDSASSTSCPPSSLVTEKNVRRLVNGVFMGQMSFQSPSHQHQSTDPNHWPRLILSSSTNRLLMEWTLLLGCYRPHGGRTTGPHLWNMLPIHLRHCDSVVHFKWLLKTYLFGGWDRGALCTC